ncbi:type II toxin-antitoxin system Phd/YefM family antitoxin [Crenalkalicoccus roseus]|uniref:type II toxin-antitoxin system Phd/YefM family antitoxin n=1 Tax=Crenalkalicoccus roseus TaxID=1485588 RepID=UPI0010818135|nr:type II toxin-antitoxin system Phd/YefM family antitoxin [Crenalkalicoccus roseus]
MPARRHEDEALRTTPEGDPAPGLEGLPRAGLEALEAALPGLIDRMLRGPVVLTRHGRDAFVLLPLDAYRRLWLSAPRPPVIGAEEP